MQLQAVAKGAALGAAAGMAGYLLFAATGSEKSRLKRRTVRAIRSLGAVADSISDIMHL